MTAFVIKLGSFPRCCFVIVLKCPVHMRQKDAASKMCLANIKPLLQGKHLGSLFDDKHTNGLFNGECRKTTSETKLHNFLTQFRETANI